MNKKYRSWTIYGDWFQHPNGYPLKDLKTLNFESGPQLEKDEKVEVTESAYVRELEAKVKELSDEIESLKYSLEAQTSLFDEEYKKLKEYEWKYKELCK